MTRPLDFPPPFGAVDAVAAPTDAPEERIEVGILVVGGGPGGLACAIRLGQLLEEHPEVRERLGDVPVAVLEKGKQPGSHLVSGAVVNPRPLRKLFNGRLTMADVPTYGEVPGEAVYVLSRRSALRIPPPPTMRNHGNVILSLSALARFLAEQAEALGVAVLPESAATKLLVQHGRVVGVRTGDRGRGRGGEPLATFEPGSDVVAGVTVLAEGTQGLLTTAAIERFGLEGENPQIWALGVKEVWRVPRPLRRIVHTMGWPLRTLAGYGEFGGSFIYPMGDELVTIGFVAGLEARDVEFSVHDVLQELKTHRLVWKILAGGERVAWGAKTITEGGYHSFPRRFTAPGLLLVGEGPGLVNVPRLKGIHYAIESGRLAAEAAFRAVQRGEVASRVGALDSYDEALRASTLWKELYDVRNMRQAFDRGFFVGGALASLMTVTKGRVPNGRFPTHANAAAPLMKTVPGAGSADAGFARDMSVHHQQAVEMAYVVRDRTDDEDVRRLAYDIAQTQANQRGMLLGWLDLWDLPKVSADPPMTWMGMGDAPSAGEGSLMPGMATDAEMKKLGTLNGEKAEVFFLQLMTAHHKGGIHMAEGCLDKCAVGVEKRLARTMVNGQQAEIDLMADMLRERGAEPRA